MKDDVDRLMEIMDVAFEPRWREAWTRRQVTDSLETPSTYAVLIDPTGEIPAHHTDAAGFILVRKAPWEQELLLIAVRPDCRGNGLGRKLLEALDQIARADGAERIYLEMRDGNPAERLYRDVGFEPIGRRRAYYTTTDGERLDAITFGKSL